MSARRQKVHRRAFLGPADCRHARGLMLLAARCHQAPVVIRPKRIKLRQRALQCCSPRRTPARFCNACSVGSCPAANHHVASRRCFQPLLLLLDVIHVCGRPYASVRNCAAFCSWSPCSAISFPAATNAQFHHPHVFSTSSPSSGGDTAWGAEITVRVSYSAR